MDTLGKVVQELDYKHFQNLKLDMGGMNLVVHAIVVVTIGLVTSRMLLPHLLLPCCHLLVFAK